MQTSAGLIKLKTGSNRDVQEWKETLERRREEAVQTLIDEGVEIESWFQVGIDGDQYLLWYMRSEAIERAHDAFAESTHDIDAFHAQIMKKITDKMISTLPLIDLTKDG